MRKSWQPRFVDGAPDRVILFDGVCVLCSRWVRFVHDPEATFRFVALQEPDGRALAERPGIDTGVAETNAVILGGRACSKSDPAIEVVSHLRCWSWVRALRAVPRPVRDAIAPRGLSVVRAILSYAGRPVRVFTDGVRTEQPGWTSSGGGCLFLPLPR